MAPDVCLSASLLVCLFAQIGSQGAQVVPQTQVREHLLIVIQQNCIRPAEGR